MMHGLLLTYKEFIATIKMSRLPLVLLEGSRDKAFFTRMCEVALNTAPQKRITITTAEQIASGISGVGNRAKVEKICELVAQHPFRCRFLGFVDREFREFTLRQYVCDDLRTHRCQGRLVWTRGHSIENYMFDFEVIKRPLMDCSVNDDIAVIALRILQAQFSDVIGIGCALGLVGLEQDQLAVVRRTVDWKTVGLVGGEFRWDIERWKEVLVERSDLTACGRARLVDGFQRWHEITKISHPDDVRWACDGHIGLNLIWTAYARAIYDIAGAARSKPNATNQKAAILGVNHAAKFNHLTRNWAAIRGGTGEESPVFCLDMVGLIYAH